MKYKKELKEAGIGNKDWFLNRYENHLKILGLVFFSIFTLFFAGMVVHYILFSYYSIEELEFVNADFEWVDNFQSYEVTIVHNDQPHYLTIKDNKVKFIYDNEDFLNFVIVGHHRRIVDNKDRYTIKEFYINLNYKGELELL